MKNVKSVSKSTIDVGGWNKFTNGLYIIHCYILKCYCLKGDLHVHVGMNSCTWARPWSANSIRSK